MLALPKSSQVGVIGAGTMGAGIAQVAAAAGHQVLLFDAQEGAAETGRRRMLDGLEKLIGKSRMTREEAKTISDSVQVASHIEALAETMLVVEAIVEDLQTKREVAGRLERILASDAIIASNTSSISITSIARGAAHPGRFAGLHFFNPAPVMKLVEVISGVATAPEVADRLFETAKAWGKVPVKAQSTPGFIVNRVARPFYAEALRLYEEQVADPATLDALLTGAGFRMGPFELMDLIGHDVNYSVTASVFEASYHDPRFRPSLVQLELINAGHLGRKSGRGFYSYGRGDPRPEPAIESKVEGIASSADLTLGEAADLENVSVLPTDGRTAAGMAKVSGKPVIVYDLATRSSCPSHLAFAVSNDVPASSLAAFVESLQSRGIEVVRLPDWPGLVVMRTLAMLANEGFEAVLQGVAEADDVDSAMRYGVNYPRGPIEWAKDIGLERILSVLDTIHTLTGDPRYRASLALRLAAAAQ